MTLGMGTDVAFLSNMELNIGIKLDLVRCLEFSL